jgi:hypothetical protein
MPLPDRGAPLDLREEESDGAAGKLGHDPLQIRGRGAARLSHVGTVINPETYRLTIAMTWVE